MLLYIHNTCCNYCLHSTISNNSIHYKYLHENNSNDVRSLSIDFGLEKQDKLFS